MDISELKTENDAQHKEIKESIKTVSDKTDVLSTGLAALTGKAETTKMLILYIVVPLIVILGGLVGIKLAIPTA